MLATSYRKVKRQREGGISLSRTSSLQKFPENKIKNLNQSFQLFQPTKNNMSVLENNSNLRDSCFKQNKENRSGVGTRNKVKYHSSVSEEYAGKSGRTKNNCKSHRMALQNSTHHNIMSNDNNQESINLWQQAQSIGQMIDLLGQYQKNCQKSMDLSSAQQARKKINQLKKQQIKTRRKQLQFQGKQYIIKTRRQRQEQLKQFNQFWQQKIKQAFKALQQIESRHIQQQRKQLDTYEKHISEQQNPHIKYSSVVLQTRRRLTSLIKSRKYKQAEHLKSILQKKEGEQQQKWQMHCQERKVLRVKQFRKKQNQELQAFRIKLSSSFNQLMMEKEKQQERMWKKMKKKEVESMKTPSSIVRAKKNLLNQSKARIEKEDY